MIVVDLPFPDPRLNPNSSMGRHWAATSDLRKKARKVATLATMAAIGRTEIPAGDLALTITFVAPDRRHRDRDNLLAASKPMLDGVADALGVNDSCFEPVTISREFGSKPGAVRIAIKWRKSGEESETNPGKDCNS